MIWVFVQIFPSQLWCGNTLAQDFPLPAKNLSLYIEIKFQKTTDLALDYAKSNSFNMFLPPFRTLLLLSELEVCMGES